MKAKFTLEARIAGNFQVVEIRKDPKTKKRTPIPLDGVSSYYVRFTEAGKRKRVSVGSDLAEAFAKFGSYELGRNADQLGIELPPEVTQGRQTLAEAREQFFADRKQLNPKSVGVYSLAIDRFIASCRKTYVQDVEASDLIHFRDWMAEQPAKKRKHANPARTQANHMGHVAIFLKAFGKEKLLPKSQYPKFFEKKIVAHSDAELELLYRFANAEERFLLDFFLGTMARDSDAMKCRYEDLTGETVTFYGKKHKTRTVQISPRLAAAIRERRKVSDSEYLFPNLAGEPNQHLLRDLQTLAKRAGAKFHTELHKLRKTAASRRYLMHVPLMTLMNELGHESLAITQKYLQDVHPEETKKAVAAADFIPTPKIVRTGTSGD